MSEQKFNIRSMFPLIGQYEYFTNKSQCEELERLLDKSMNDVGKILEEECKAEGIHVECTKQEFHLEPITDNDPDHIRNNMYTVNGFDVDPPS